VTQTNIEDLPPKGQRTAEDAKRFFGEPSKNEAIKRVTYERDGHIITGPASGRGKGKFRYNLSLPRERFRDEPLLATAQSSNEIGTYDTLDEALTAAINQYEPSDQIIDRMVESAKEERERTARRMGVTPTRTAHTIVLDRLIQAKRSGNKAQESQANEQLRPQLMSLLERLEQGTLNDGERQALLSRYQELETLTTGAAQELAQEIVSRLQGEDNFDTMPEVESVEDLRAEFKRKIEANEGDYRLYVKLFNAANYSETLANVPDSELFEHPVTQELFSLTVGYPKDPVYIYNALQNLPKEYTKRLYTELLRRYQETGQSSISEGASVGILQAYTHHFEQSTAPTAPPPIEEKEHPLLGLKTLDLDPQQVRSSYRNISHAAGKRAESERREWAETLDQLEAQAESEIQAGAKREEVEKRYQKLARRLLRTKQNVISARAQTASSAITGAGQFNARQAQKRQQVLEGREAQYRQALKEIKDTQPPTPSPAREQLTETVREISDQPARTAAVSRTPRASEATLTGSGDLSDTERRDLTNRARFITSGSEETTKTGRRSRAQKAKDQELLLIYNRLHSDASARLGPLAPRFADYSQFVKLQGGDLPERAQTRADFRTGIMSSIEELRNATTAQPTSSTSGRYAPNMLDRYKELHNTSPGVKADYIRKLSDEDLGEMRALIDAEIARVQTLTQEERAAADDASRAFDQAGERMSRAEKKLKEAPFNSTEKRDLERAYARARSEYADKHLEVRRLKRVADDKYHANINHLVGQLSRPLGQEERKRARRTQKSANHLINYRAQLLQTIERIA
jgi:hypothetical protein